MVENHVADSDLNAGQILSITFGFSNRGRIQNDRIFWDIAQDLSCIGHGICAVGNYDHVLYFFSRSGKIVLCLHQLCNLIAAFRIDVQFIYDVVSDKFISGASIYLFLDSPFTPLSSNLLDLKVYNLKHPGISAND